MTLIRLQCIFILHLQRKSSPWLEEELGKAVRKPQPFFSMVQQSHPQQCPLSHSPTWLLSPSHQRLFQPAGKGYRKVNSFNSTVIQGVFLDCISFLINLLSKLQDFEKRRAGSGPSHQNLNPMLFLSFSLSPEFNPPYLLYCKKRVVVGGGQQEEKLQNKRNLKIYLSKYFQEKLSLQTELVDFVENPMLTVLCHSFCCVPLKCLVSGCSGHPGKGVSDFSP